MRLKNWVWGQVAMWVKGAINLLAPHPHFRRHAMCPCVGRKYACSLGVTNSTPHAWDVSLKSSKTFANSDSDAVHRWFCKPWNYWATIKKQHQYHHQKNKPNQSKPIKWNNNKTMKQTNKQKNLLVVVPLKCHIH